MPHVCVFRQPIRFVISQEERLDNLCQSADSIKQLLEGLGQQVAEFTVMRPQNRRPEELFDEVFLIKSPCVFTAFSTIILHLVAILFFLKTVDPFPSLQFFCWVSSVMAADMTGGSSDDVSLRSVDSTKWNSVPSFGSTIDSESTNSFNSRTGALFTSGRTSFSSLSFCARLTKLLKRKSYAAERIPTEERSRTTRAEIERSKVHWSDLNPVSADSQTSRANWEAFEILKENPDWGSFFSYYDDPEVELELGEKIAEGGQAEIFLATERRRNKQGGRSSSSVVCVAKVFKIGFSLQVLQSQWPLGMLRDLSRGGCGFLAGGILWVRHGTMLNDGRFAFILERMWGDLRRVVDHKMQKSGGPPFDHDTATLIMLEIAGGMLELHQRGVIHRDLKASNVLVDSGYGVDPRDETFECKIADFESSVGVVGTGFWRAPEILRAVRDGEVKLLDLFTQESDVYSYAMTCYEILTGGLPFQGHPRTDYDLVLNGGRPELPEWVTSELKELLERCWHSDPSCRPKFAEIMDTLQNL